MDASERAPAEFAASTAISTSRAAAVELVGTAQLDAVREVLRKERMLPLLPHRRVGGQVVLVRPQRRGESGPRRMHRERRSHRAGPEDRHPRHRLTIAAGRPRPPRRIRFGGSWTSQRYLQVDDYEPVAKSKLPADVYDYYAGGAGDERTLEENLRAFDRWVLRPRFLRGSSFPDPSTELLGTRVEFPVLVAPWAYQGRAHPDGERGTVVGAARAGTIPVVSSTAVDALEEIAAATEGPKWWQVYLFAEQERSAKMLRRVAAAGYERSAGPSTSPWRASGIATRAAGS